MSPLAIAAQVAERLGEPGIALMVNRSGRSLYDVAEQLDRMAEPASADDVRALDRAAERCVAGLVARMRIERAAASEPPATLPGVVVEVMAAMARVDAVRGIDTALSDDTGGAWRRSIADETREICEEAVRAGRESWRLALAEEVAEAFAENEPAKLRAELVQVATVALRWVRAIDARGQR